MRRVHSLKTWPEYFQPSVSGIKTFELRDDDRNFQTGDTLILKEYVRCSECNDLGVVNPDGCGLESVPCLRCNGHKGDYTGHEARFVVTYVLRGPKFGLSSQYCVMAIKPLYAHIVGNLPVSDFPTSGEQTKEV